MRPELRVIEGGLTTVGGQRPSDRFCQPHLRRVSPLEEVLLYLLRRVPERAAASGTRDMFGLISVAIDELTEAQGRYAATTITLSEATLFAVEASAESGAPLQAIREFVTNVYGLEAPAKDVSMALRTHQRKGLLIRRVDRWFPVEPAGDDGAA